MKYIHKPKYEKIKDKLINDENVCKSNRSLYDEFFKYQEYKLKRINGLSELDESTYKTLYFYVMRIKNVNEWFKNKPLKDLTEEDIKKVYDDLEDGKILTNKGKPIKSKKDYYSKIFKSKLFELAGKKELAQKIIQFTNETNSEVRFVKEEDFLKLIDYAYKIPHKLLFWLAWDIGENISSLLRLKKSDFYKEKNPNTKETEYRVNLRKEILKRSRKERSEITNYDETVKLLDFILKDLDDDEELFKFNYSNAKKILTRALDRAEIKCLPKGDKPTWKDLRSGMACDLLKKGWSTDEVNARLGHKPSSDEIDKYVNFLALDRHRPKKKVKAFEMERLTGRIDEQKEQMRLQQQRYDNLKNEMEEKLDKNNDNLLRLIKLISDKPEEVKKFLKN